MFVNYFIGQLPTISALLAIGCLKPPASLAIHACSTSLQVLHRYSYVLVCIAIVGHHSAKAEFREVNGNNFEGTPYKGTPVRLNGQDISFTLDKREPQVNVAWRFNSDWQIRLEKCDIISHSQLEISNSCKWVFDWLDNDKFTLKPNGTSDEKPWSLKDLNQEHVTKLRINIGQFTKTQLYLCAVTNSSCPPIGGSLELTPPHYCMLDKDIDNTFSVKMINREQQCQITVTIVNAQLLYDVYEPTTASSLTISPGGNSDGYGKDGKTTTTPNDDVNRNSTEIKEDSNIIIYAASGGVAGFVLLAAIVGVIVFCFIRRRRRGPAFGKDADNAQITQTEGLIEWEDIMAHAPYKALLGKQLEMKLL